MGWKVSILASIAINILIFGVLPFLTHVAATGRSTPESIEVDVVKIKKKVEKPPTPPPSRRHSDRRRRINQSLLRRITFEIDPGLFGDEFDLVLPDVIYDVSEVDTPPEITRYVAPYFPRQALRMGIEGVVTLRIFVNEAGEVRDIQVVDDGGFHGFVIEAIRAIRKWRFEPARFLGKKVGVWCLQKVRFQLKR